MKRVRSESSLPINSAGEIKLDSSVLDISERYWVMVTAHNEKFSSRVAKIDFQPLDPAGKWLKNPLLNCPMLTKVDYNFECNLLFRTFLN